MTPADNELMRLTRRIDELSDRVRVLEDGLQDHGNLYRKLGLTTHQAAILALLMNREFVSRGTIYTALYGNRRGGGPDENIIQVWVSKLRKCLKIKIEMSQSAPGSCNGGYRISAETKQQIRNKLNSAGITRAA